jgi:hypothetical protein
MYITQDYDEALARTESVESLQIESVLSLFSYLVTTTPPYVMISGARSSTLRTGTGSERAAGNETRHFDNPRV